jgi:outer membrane receptor protein involved in Fe transport
MLKSKAILVRAVAFLALIPLPILIVPTHAGAAESASQSFNISPQSLATALSEFARQSQRELLFSPELVAEKTTTGVRGNLEPLEALAALLKNTGIDFSTTPNGAILLKSKNSTAPTGNIHLAQSDSAENRSSTENAGKQESSSSSSAQGTEKVMMHEVIVSAQKRAERLLDVPQSVSVLTAEDLNRLGVTQFRDFADTVPGLSFSTAGAGVTQIALRGVTTGFDVSPTVGIYVDEVPYGSTTPFSLNAQFRLDAALFDLDRIEVLRGPQGTLYGASSMGGLIKYVTRQPDMNRFGRTIRAGISGTQDGGLGYFAAGAINMPLVADKVALRAGVFESHDGGFINNVAREEKDINDSDIYGGRVDLLLAPTNALSIRLSAFLQNIARNGEGTADYTFAGTKPFGDRQQSRFFAEPFDQRFRIVSATLNYDMDFGVLTSISSYQTTSTEYFADVSAVYVPLLAFFGLDFGAIAVPNPLSTDKFTQEVRLASRRTNEPFEWVIGGFYTDEDSKNDQSFVLRDVNGQPVENNLYSVSRPSSYQEYAAFGNLTWHLNDKFDVTLGLRYARNEQDFSQTNAGLLLPPTPPDARSSEDVFTYLANARYRLSDRATAYLRYATGYRPGGPNVVTGVPGPATFESDRLKSYEAGLKAETGDRRFGIDLSAYHIDWSDIQVLVILGGFGTYDNARGGATIDGAELTLTARPGSALTLRGAVAFQDATMSEADAVLQARKGERLPNVPRLTSTLDAEYDFAGPAVQPTLGATVRYVGDREASFDASLNYPQYDLPSYTTMDVRFGLMLGSIETQLYVHNLFDELGEQSLILPQFGPRVAILQPRTFGISLTARF